MSAILTVLGIIFAAFGLIGEGLSRRRPRARWAFTCLAVIGLFMSLLGFVLLAFGVML